MFVTIDRIKSLTWLFITTLLITSCQEIPEPTVSLTQEEQGTQVRWHITFEFHPLHPLSWTATWFVAGFRRVVRSGLSELRRQLAQSAAKIS